MGCEECQDCGGGGSVGNGNDNAVQFHIDSNFLQSTSSTFHNDISCNDCMFGTCSSNKDDKDSNKCIRTQRYSEGSQFTSQEVVDVVSPPPPKEQQLSSSSSSSFQFHFGCQSEVSREFRKQLADGVMGMDKNPKSSFWKQAYDQKLITNQSFSLCYSGNDPYQHEKYKENAGLMTLGGTDTNLHDTTMVYADQIELNGPNNKNYYTVRIKKIYFRSYQAGTSVAATPVTTANTPEVQQQQEQADFDNDMIPINVDETTLNGGGI